MQSTVEPLEGNKVKVSVSVDDNELDQAVEAAFRKIAREVRIPGFRPGKAPRRILEARLGPDVARGQALQDAVPEWYVAALREHEVDVIAAPEFDITSGEDDGPVSFDAVVEVRPSVSIDGYRELKVELERPVATDEEVDAQVERLRQQFGELAEVEREVRDGDHATIDITGSRDGEPLPGLQAEDYLYEVGSGGVAPELDEALVGAAIGADIEFVAQPADAEQDPVDFQVVVKGLQEKVLPEVTDEWAGEVSEFDSVEALRADLSERMVRVRRSQGRSQLSEKVAGALAELVTDDVPDALLQAEVQERLQQLSMRLSAQGMTFEQYMQMVGRTQEQLVADLRDASGLGVRIDLALRALAEAEGLEADDDDVEHEIEHAASHLDEKPAKLRQRLDREGRLPAVRSDIRTRKALDWLLEHVELVDTDGAPLDRSVFDDPDEVGDDGGDGAPSDPESATQPAADAGDQEQE